MSKKVLIADDAPFIREVFKNLLAATNYEIVGEAKDGQEAIELAKKHQPDVILMDIVMPEVSGIAATKEILEVLPNTQIIACSTLDQENLVTQALEAGCVHYITKPFEKVDVLRAIEKAVSQKGDS